MHADSLRVSIFLNCRQADKLLRPFKLILQFPLPNSFFLWNFKFIFCVTESIDNANILGFFGEFADHKFLIFPPWNLSDIMSDIQM